MNRPLPDCRRPWQRFLLVVSLGCFAVTALGCTELKSRRKLQEANKLFKEGKFAFCPDGATPCLTSRDCWYKADDGSWMTMSETQGEGVKGKQTGVCKSEMLDLYEQAMKLTPKLEVGRYNTIIAYHKMFRPGNKDPENLYYGNKAVDHLEAYLKNHPHKEMFVKLRTRLLMDLGKYDRALEYWLKKYKEDPTHVEVIHKIASINLQAKRWDEGIKWLEKEVAAAKDVSRKVLVLTDIGERCFSRLHKKREIRHLERLQFADLGLYAVKRILALDDIGLGARSRAHNLAYRLYQQRSVAHGASWAQTADLAPYYRHFHEFTRLNKLVMAAAKAKREREEREKKQQGDDGEGG